MAVGVSGFWRGLAAAFIKAGLLLAGLCCLTSSPVFSAPSDTAAAPRAITVVIDDSYPPYAFRDHAGRLQGIRKDAWDLWSARTGVKVNLVGMDWAKAQAQIQVGQADVIDTIFETGPRKDIYDFGASYADIEVPIFFHESIGGVASAETLKGFSIGVKEGDACVDYLVNQGLESFRKYPSYEAVIDAAAVGEVRVFCQDRPPAAYFLARKQLERQFRSSRPLYIGQFRWAVRKGDAATFKLVQDGFAKVSHNEMLAVQERWLAVPDQDISLPPAVRYAAYVLLWGSSVVLVLAVWNLSLKRRVAQRTRHLSDALAQLTGAKQHAERSLAQLNATLEAIPDLLFELDLDGRYIDYRASRPELLVAPPEQLIGRRVHDVMPPESAELVMQAVHEAAEHGASTGVQIKLDLPPGERWFELSVARKRMSGGRDHFIMLSRDVTDRKQTEQTLTRHGDELEKIVHDRSRQLVEARDASEQASRAKSEFLSRMSHELRSPMNAILGFSQLIEMESDTSVRTQGHVHEILRAGKHLLHLINDVLDLEEVESGRVPLTPEAVDMAALAREVINLMQPLADQAQVILRIGDMNGVSVMADAARLKQVVLNLMSNAVKYNRRGGEVWLDAQALPCGQLARISVRDNGVGIAEGHMGQLFQPFQRLGAQASQIEGAGIGLSLCRRLTELMRGHIGVNSREGEGSTFWVELPRVDAPAGVNHIAVGPTKAGGLPSPRLATVLYIEDNPANLQLMAQIVARHKGVSLISAPHGRTGLDLARAHRPDLVLLDIHLPDIDGYAVLGHLRDEHDMPVIAVTANAMPMDVQRIRDAGFDDYVAKPIKVTNIDMLIHERLGTSLA